MRTLIAGAAALVLTTVLAAAQAVDTENIGLQVVPAPGAVRIDGNVDDWDLTGGVFICNDVVNTREQASAWFHAMYDADYVYFLVRFNDPTPMNHQGRIAGDAVWQGDCLQLRITTHPEDRDRQLHIWLDAAYFPNDEQDIITISYPSLGRRERVANALDAGAKQAFRVYDDGSGYIQEMAIPWALLTLDEQPLQAGDSFRLTAEPQFTIGESLSRIQLVDIWREGMARSSFSWSSMNHWGIATLETEGNLDPRPVRLSDGREFPIAMRDGMPRVDWTGVVAPWDPSGHIPIEFALEHDGYVTLVIEDETGRRVRNLFSDRFFTVGEHTVKWDGLDDGASWPAHGKPVDPGTYRWRGLYRDTINLVYRGHYGNAGNPPWSNFQAASDWGGDHGDPVGAVSDGERVYLAWSSGEASSPLIAVDPNDDAKLWGQRRYHSGHRLLAIDGTHIYTGLHGRNIWLIDAKTGGYLPIPATGEAEMPVPAVGEAGQWLYPDGIAARDGMLYFSFGAVDAVKVVSTKSGEIERSLAVAAPGRMDWIDAHTLAVISADTVVALDIANDRTDLLVEGLDDPRSIAVGKDGRLYVACWGDTHQVKVFESTGQWVRDMGIAGGRPKAGPWQRDGLLNPLGLTVGPNGDLWIGEFVRHPNRWTIWNPAGELQRELFGAAHYGADGGALNPADPYLGVGSMAEWRVDPETGRGECLGVIAHDGQTSINFNLERTHSSRYVQVGDTWYLVQGMHRYYSAVRIYRREGDGDFTLLSVIGNAIQPDVIRRRRGQGDLMEHSDHAYFQGRAGQVFVWTDRSGDGQVHRDEIEFFDLGSQFEGAWQHLGVNNSLNLYMVMSNRQLRRFPVTDMSDRYGPRYDLSAGRAIVANAGWTGSFRTAMPDARETTLIHHGSWITGYDMESGAVRWRYPNQWIGVHGSHNAPRHVPGMLRGTFAIVGGAVLANGEEVFAINSNVGQWHLMTTDGLYVSSLFESSMVEHRWPTEAVPGVLLTSAAPGMGGEDFGGSFTGTADGRAFIQCGKTGFWIVEVDGLNSLKRLEGGSIEQTADGVLESHQVLTELQREPEALAPYVVRRFTPTLDGDIGGWPEDRFHAYDDGAIRFALAYDDTHLYLAAEVRDAAAVWANNASEPAMMYSRGDTVDFQFGADPDADPNRASAVEGDTRVSIGNFQGRPTAVIYREAGPTMGGRPMTVSSGVVDAYTVASVKVLEHARIAVDTRDDSYFVEAAIPFEALGIEPASGLELRGDVGVTFSDASGSRVVQRRYWSNRNTGLVDDEVFELRVQPRNWGDLHLE